MRIDIWDPRVYTLNILGIDSQVSQLGCKHLAKNILSPQVCFHDCLFRANIELWPCDLAHICPKHVYMYTCDIVCI